MRSISGASLFFPLSRKGGRADGESLLVQGPTQADLLLRRRETDRLPRTRQGVVQALQDENMDGLVARAVLRAMNPPLPPLRTKISRKKRGRICMDWNVERGTRGFLIYLIDVFVLMS